MSTNEALLATIDNPEGGEAARHRLAPRLLFYILLFSSFVTLVATGLQLYLEYSRDVREIDVRLTQIERSYLNSIALSLWIMDYEQLRIQLEGIQALPDMQYLEVQSDGKTLITVGQKPSSKLLHRSYTLTYRYRGDRLDLGTLHVAANLEDVYQRLLDRVLVIFASQAVKTFLVAGFILIIFQLMITRHLQHISEHVRALRLGQSTKPLSLPRKRRLQATPDELDDVVNAFNKMCDHLAASYRRLAESEERFDLAMRGTNDGLWDWSLDAGSAYFSPRCAEILGMRPDELGAGPEAWQARLPPEDRRRFRQSMREHLKGETANFECMFRVLVDGSTIRWVWSRGQALRRGDGHAYRVVGTHMDITVQKENEAALAAANRRVQEEQEKRAEAERLACIGELSASIAHEIRNPLASIVNSLELLADDLPPEERRGVTEIVNSETRQLQRILNDFLGFARLRASEMAQADIVETLSDAVTALEMTIDDLAAIELCFEPHARSCLVRCDADQLRQVIWNLALNALHAMPDGGVLRVRTSREDDAVWIHVVDTGHGIPADMLDKVTRPFVTDREDGTGLGLAVVKRILDQHASRLHIYTQPGRGTEVRFSLNVVNGHE